jgi:diguanylate cyclase (GGDEF)-like protein
MYKSKILIVDDKKENVFSLRELLQEENNTIFEAFSGEECLMILLNETVDLVLLDIQMPKMDGYETATYIRENDRTKTIPIIFVTAATKTDSINLKGYQNGAIDIIYKPINPTILRSKVSLFLEIAESRKKLEEQVSLLTRLNEENKQMQAEIEQLALQDYLTKVSNRRKLDTDLQNLYRNAYRNKESIAIMMIDLDNFKGYNDYFGHTVGDEALKEIAKTIQETISRPLDTVGRFGGEEFLVILPKTDAAGAMKIAERIREAVYNLNIKHSPTNQYKYMSISIGVTACIPTDYNDALEIVKKSDKALYMAKNDGRNKAVLYK